METAESPAQVLVKREEDEFAPGSSNHSSSSDLSVAGSDSSHMPEDGAAEAPSQSPAEEASEAGACRPKRRSGPRSKTSNYLGVTKVHSVIRVPVASERHSLSRSDPSNVRIQH